MLNLSLLLIFRQIYFGLRSDHFLAARPPEVFHLWPESFRVWTKLTKLRVPYLLRASWFWERLDSHLVIGLCTLSEFAHEVIRHQVALLLLFFLRVVSDVDLISFLFRLMLLSKFSVTCDRVALQSSQDLGLSFLELLFCLGFHYVDLGDWAGSFDDNILLTVVVQSQEELLHVESVYAQPLHGVLEGRFDCPGLEKLDLSNQVVNLLRQLLVFVLDSAVDNNLGYLLLFLFEQWLKLNELLFTDLVEK